MINRLLCSWRTSAYERYNSRVALAHCTPLLLDFLEESKASLALKHVPSGDALSVSYAQGWNAGPLMALHSRWPAAALSFAWRISSQEPVIARLFSDQQVDCLFLPDRDPERLKNLHPLSCDVSFFNDGRRVLYSVDGELKDSLWYLGKLEEREVYAHKVPDNEHHFFSGPIKFA